MTGVMMSADLRKYAAEVIRLANAADDLARKYGVHVGFAIGAAPQAAPERPPASLPETVDLPAPVPVQAVEPEAESVPQAVPASQPASALPPVLAGLPGWQRALRVHLNALGYRKGWDAALDLDLCERLRAGEKLPLICADLGIDSADGLARWKQLTGPLCDDRGRVTLTGQGHLAQEPKARVRWYLGEVA